MNTLINGNRRIQIDDSTYFPFTQKINDMENVDIIGMPASKTISIPRCPQNDEFFGYIGENNRINHDYNDEKLGVSFNQIKKCKYELMNGNEIVSTGIIQIDNITETDYEVTLYDILIDQIEQLSTVNLNDLDIITSNDLPYEFNSYAQTVTQLITGTTTEIKAVVNNRTFDEDKKTLKCYKNTDTNISIPDNYTLPIDCTPLQLRTLKDYNVNYAIPIKTVINSINKTSNDKFDNSEYPTIEYSQDLEEIFNDVHILSNVPSNTEPYYNYVLNQSGVVSGQFEGSTGTTISFEPKDGLNPICDKNGNFYFEIPFIINFTAPVANQQRITWWHISPDESPQFWSNTTPDGTKIGEIYINMSLSALNSTGETIYTSLVTTNKVELILGVNTFVVYEGINVKNVRIYGTSLFTIDYYPLFFNNNYNKTNLNFNITCMNPSDANSYTSFLDEKTKLTDVEIPLPSTEYNVTYNVNTFRSGDKINGANIFPSVSIKDFLISTVKYFNLGIENVNGNIRIFKKVYKNTNDLLIIDGVPDLNNKLVTYSMLKLKTDLSNNTLMSKYSDKYKKSFGEQHIDTGYTIKKNTKEITFDVGIPFILQDTNAFAYDAFCRYLSGGYCKVNHGDISGFNDKVVFGYINNCKQDLDIVNDTKYELTRKDVSGNTIEEKFVMWNPSIRYNSGATDGTLTWYKDILFTNDINSLVTVSNYNTFSPYQFITGKNTIKHSLEFNKPEVNYANITDFDYNNEVTHYSMYHKKTLNDKLSANTHTLTAKLYIDGKIDIYKLFNYHNTFYIISEIVEYDPTKPGIYDVILLKVNNPEGYIEPWGNELGEVVTYNILSVGDISYVGHNYINGGGTVTYLGRPEATERGIVIATNPNPTINDSKWIAPGMDLNPYMTMMTGLTEDTDYFWKAYIKNEAGIAYGDLKSFYTMSRPVVSITGITNVTINSGKATMSVQKNGNRFTGSVTDYNITKYGLVYSTNHNPTYSDNKVEIVGSSPDKDIPVQFTMSGLQAGTTYYVRSFAYNNGAGFGYSSELSFTTSLSTPIVTTTSITNITDSTVNSGGNITSDGGSAIIAKGICWAVGINPSLSDAHTNDGIGAGLFNSVGTGLTSNTIYHIRAYATNSIGTSYGNDITGVTLGLPGVTLSSITNVDNNNAYTGGNVIEDGNTTVTERGVIWGNYPGITLSDAYGFTLNGAGLGSFTSYISGLSGNTTYYVRAYATNSVGTKYSISDSFTTTDGAEVTTNLITNITNTTATCGGIANNNSGSEITQRGVCWNTTGLPTIANNHTIDGIGNGSFTSNLTGLAGSTTYYVRSYVTNSTSTYYGNEVSFKTYDLPSVNTSSISNLTDTTATCGGNVTNENGSTVTERGICWSTNSNPSLSGSHIINGIGLGSFISNLEGLNSLTTYYVRAYATNSFGTRYGNEVQFITNGRPSVSMYDIENLGNTYVTFGGHVESTGGVELIDKGFIWLQGTGYFDIDNYTGIFSDGSTVEDFSITPNDLLPNTFYQVKAYILNQYGYEYSDTQSFTTEAPVTLANIVTTSISSTSGTEISVNGNLVDTGGDGGVISEKGVVYAIGDSSNPKISELSIYGEAPAFYAGAGPSGTNGLWLRIELSMNITQGTLSLVSTDRFHFNGFECILNGSDSAGEVFNSTLITFPFDDSTVQEWSFGVNGLNLVWWKDMSSYFFGSAYDLSVEAGIRGYMSLSAISPEVIIYNQFISIYPSQIKFNDFSSNAIYTPVTPTILTGKKLHNNTSIGNFNVTIDNLTYNTLYSVAAFATNQVGTSYGAAIDVSTQR